MQVNVHEAKTQLSRLIERVLAGESITIARAGKPLIDLVPHVERPAREFGRYRGQIRMSPDFDELPADLLAGMLHGSLEPSPAVQAINPLSAGSSEGAA